MATCTKKRLIRWIMKIQICANWQWSFSCFLIPSFALALKPGNDKKPCVRIFTICNVGGHSSNPVLPLEYEQGSIPHSRCLLLQLLFVPQHHDDLGESDAVFSKTTWSIRRCPLMVRVMLSCFVVHCYILLYFNIPII